VTVSGPIAVDVVDVSKRFRLYHEKVTSLKERVLRAGRNPYEDFWALRDVSFDIHEGETVGIVGRNGSGKSTLLKCVSGILQPTEGKVVVRGSTAALLELGAGFQPELSGRDNIYLNASLLGLSSREVARRFDEIVAFAELENFIDNQVKFYSSGMYVRLGFAVAVSVEPDILVVDEVLAVGDENFQRKCLERIKEFQNDGRTIIFVTHSLDLVRQICDRAVVLEGGLMAGSGTPGEAIRLFRELLLEPTAPVEAATAPGPAAGEPAEVPAPVGVHPVSLLEARLEYPGEGSRAYLLPGESLRIVVDFDVHRPVRGAVFAIEIHDQDGELVFGTDTDILGVPFEAEPGAGRSTFSFDRVPLLDGTYDVSLGVRSASGGEVFDWRDQLVQFEVMNPGRSTGHVALEVEAEISVRAFAEPAEGRAGV
jgi:ABC-2 type transport system ATP-binding protein